MLCYAEILSALMNFHSPQHADRLNWLKLRAGGTTFR